MKTITTVLIFFIFSFGFAQDIPTSFSLQEAIDYALENNRQAKNAGRDIESAKQQKWETTATGLPQLTGNINYQNFLKQQVSVVPAEFFGGNPGEFAEVIFGTKQNASATATLNQMLFDGSYLVGLQSAKVFLDISENAKIKTDLEVRKAVINAYGNVLLAEESINILEKNIEDEPGNTTRFLVIGKKDALPSGDDKTSLMFSMHNKAGGLHSILAPLAEHGISMTRIESRPSRRGRWDYVFFVDIEGHRKDEKVAIALQVLERAATLFRILGSYPKAVL